MSQTDTALATLIGSRLCHDLISPIGAIQNGLELVTLAGGADTSAEMTLISDSCDNASGRIRFYRIAFGTAGSGQSLSARETIATLEALTRSGKVAADWRITGDMPRTQVQMALLAFLCCEASLPAGGTVRFDGARDALTVRGDGPRIRIQPEVWDFLTGSGDIEQLTPDRVQFALLSVLARDRGIALQATPAEDAVQIRIG